MTVPRAAAISSPDPDLAHRSPLYLLPSLFPTPLLNPSTLHPHPPLQGFAVNPCNSKLHPSFTEAGIEPDSEEELSVQEAYTPESNCWGCGACRACAACLLHACCMLRRPCSPRPHALRFQREGSALSKGWDGQGPGQPQMRPLATHVPLFDTPAPLPLPPLPCPAGPASTDGLFLRSYRIPGGLEATTELHKKYCAFPGVFGVCALPPAFHGLPGVPACLANCLPSRWLLSQQARPH